MRYLDKHGFIGKLYYELIIVDLWQTDNGEGTATPLLAINMLKPHSGGFAVILKIPWVSIGVGFCK